jgi:hypothetical protein
VAAPPWLLPADQLSDDREIIGLRLEVVAEGPNSNGLLPIPADRVRSEGLPRGRASQRRGVGGDEVVPPTARRIAHVV